MHASHRASRSRGAEILTVAGMEAVEMVRSIRLLFLVFGYASVGLLVGYGWRSLDAQSEGQLRAFAERAASLTPEERADRLAELAQQGGPFAELMGGLVFDPVLPPVAMLVLHTSSWLLPLLILLVGYNRIADDLESRYTRYVMQRVHRDAYLGGKIVGHAAVCTVAVIVVQLLWMGIASALEMYGADRMWGATIRIWPAMVVFVLAYSAYTMLVSTAFARSVLALLLGTLVLFGVWFAFNIASFGWAPLGRVWLSSWYPALYRLDPIGVAVFVGYTAMFMLVANSILRKVDL